LVEVAQFLFIILLGFAAGFVSGAFGVGGGVITTPAIRMLLFQSSDIALGTPLPITFPSALIGGLNYWRAGKIIPRVVVYCSIFGIAGTTTGSLTTALIDTRYIMVLTALLIIYLALRTCYTAFGKDPYGQLEGVTKRRQTHVWVLALIGFFAGFFSGFLGLGGGVILVPAFFYILRLDLMECLGNSLMVIAVVAIPGTIIHTILGHVNWFIALAMIVGVMPGSYIGSFFSLRAHNRRVLLLFSFFLLAIGIIFLFKEISGLI
jgi:uncharacterized membrane protein YfcA